MIDRIELGHRRYTLEHAEAIAANWGWDIEWAIHPDTDYDITMDVRCRRCGHRFMCIVMAGRPGAHPNELNEAADVWWHRPLAMDREDVLRELKSARRKFACRCRRVDAATEQAGLFA